MEFLVVAVTGLVGLILVAILSAFYLLKRHTRSLDERNLADAAKRIPTIPMMDPDSFETADEPTEVSTR